MQKEENRRKDRPERAKRCEGVMGCSAGVPGYGAAHLLTLAKGSWTEVRQLVSQRGQPVPQWV